MGKIKCLLVDDEMPAIIILKKYASMLDQLEIVASCHNALEAFEILKEKEVDLIFLDINMPVLTGMEFIKALKSPPAFIFTTAYRDYAIESYELNAIDYLLKPFGFERFLKAIDKYQYSNQHKTNGTNESIYFTINRTNHRVLVDSILYLESLKDYTQIHTTTDKLTVRGNLSTTMQKLPLNKFIRIHRSYTIALSKIESYSQSEVTVNGKKLPMGITHRAAFLEYISK